MTELPRSLQDLLADPAVTGLSFDSRNVRPGHVFVAVPGTRVDGHDFIDRAVNAGAVAVVSQRPVDTAGVANIVVKDSATALGLMADAWYDHPSRDLKLVGITGTNGKTTVAMLCYQLFTALGYRAGLLSTVGIHIAGRELPATHTTPDAPSIQRHLAAMRDARVDYVFMEVSSHAVDQRRTVGLHFAGGVFTNLSHDHLDYHKTFDAYLKAKKCFFDELGSDAFALTNVDDKRGAVMVQNTAATVHRYSLRTKVDFHARLLANTAEGLQLSVNGTEAYFQLLGRYNAYNLLATYAVAVLLGQDDRETLAALSGLRGAAGRLERVVDPTGRTTALVDYAHTPDALENVLSTLRGVLSPDQRLLCVVGAGGDRDRGKRPEMARVAAELSDRLILTSDNPRSELPETILDEMESGIPSHLRPRTLRITDRRQAIRTAVQTGHEVVLVAGKGHETYQEINGERRPFDDRRELANALKEAAGVN